MSSIDAKHERRRARAHALIQWWLGPEGNGYEGLAQKIVELQDEVEADVRCGYGFTNEDGSVFCEISDKSKRAQNQRDVAFAYAMDLEKALRAIVEALRNEFLPDEAVEPMRKAEILLSDRRG